MQEKPTTPAFSPFPITINEWSVYFERDWGIEIIASYGHSSSQTMRIKIPWRKLRRGMQTADRIVSYKKRMKQMRQVR